MRFPPVGVGVYVDAAPGVPSLSAVAVNPPVIDPPWNVAVSAIVDPHVPDVTVPTVVRDDRLLTVLVTNVPLVGSVTFVAPVAVSVIE